VTSAAQPCLRVLQVFGYASFQGAPRNGLRQFGVPSGGAFDQESLALGNALAGNDLQTPAIELAMGAIKIEILRAIKIAIVGANCPVFLDGRAAAGQTAFDLLPGQVLDVNSPTQGARVYISCYGLLSSKASQIKAGTTVIATPTINPPDKPRSLSEKPWTLGDGPIRVIPFGTAQLPSGSMTVSIDSNRVGIRLHGPKLDLSPERLSEPACSGAIQVTNEGSLIILGPDGPTIGGYKKVGVVCSADLDKLAQLRPGQQIEFNTISREAADLAWQERNQKLEAKLKEIRP
jgi:allophanate hydrolase subunit 2